MLHSVVLACGGRQKWLQKHRKRLTVDMGRSTEFIPLQSGSSFSLVVKKIFFNIVSTFRMVAFLLILRTNCLKVAGWATV